jgi:transcriptional regulator with PAS, ATPase and Fis domain
MNINLQALKQRFGIMGNSPLLDAALGTAARVATTELSVLIQGESGVGKEAFSKVIHALSLRKHNPFIAINCGAIPEGTINSELFGHEKGAFTGALNDRKGYFETVNSGTIFLDEIGEMPHDTQAFLLRILESGEFVRVGSSKVEKTDVRIIAATNVQLEEAVRKGRFREDLFYRLSTVPIKVPSLKERPEDIYILFRKFVSDFAEKYRQQPIQLDDRARLILERYTYPGNVRELKNIAEQLSVLSTERLIKGEDLLDKMPHLLKRPLPVSTADSSDNTRFEEREIMYKLLFDMRSDLSYVKNLIAELIKTNNLSVPKSVSISHLMLPSGAAQTSMPDAIYSPDSDVFHNSKNTPDFELESPDDLSISEQQPFILEKSPNETAFDSHFEVVDENLNLAEAEKRQILKALKKHAGKRREASDDLGISERTLYRKIKEYNLE